MVKKIAEKVRPTRGFAHVFHLSLVAIVPLFIFVFVRLELYGVALALILISKWRIFAVKPRHWLAHLRTNAVDVIFSLSILTFMINTSSMSWQLLWVLVFEIWVLVIKPGTKTLSVGMQALIAQLAGLIALFIAFPEVPLAAYVIGVATILYFSARHFFASFDEDHYEAYSWSWATFGACLTWILGHWLLFYGNVAQPAVILSVLGYGFAALYYLSSTDKLSKLAQRQVGFVMMVTIVIIIILSDWGSRNA